MAWATISLTLFLLALILAMAFVRLLREEHPDLYLELGSPALIPRDPTHFSFNWKFAKFMWTGEYLRVKDPRLRRLGIANQVYTILFGLWCFWPLVC